MTEIYRGKNHLFDGAGEDVLIRAGPNETLNIQIEYSDVLSYLNESRISIGLNTKLTSIYPIHIDAIPYTNVSTLWTTNMRIQDSEINSLTCSNLIATSLTVTNLTNSGLTITTLTATNLTSTNQTITNLVVTSLTSTNLSNLTSTGLITCTNLISTNANFSKEVIASAGPVFYAIGNSSAQTISSLTVCTNYSTQQNISFTNNSFAMTVPVDGLYILCGSIDVTSAANQFTYGFSKNSDSSINLVSKKSIKAANTCLTELVQLIAGDVIRFMISPSTGSVTIAWSKAHLIIKKYY